MTRMRIALSMLLIVAVAACDVTSMITSPKSGTIVDTATVVVTGQLPGGAESGGTLVVNGITATFTDDRHWEAEVPMTPVGYVTVIHATYTDPDGVEWTQESAVINGPKIDDGEFSENGVGMLFTNTGLANLGPVINSLAGSSFDISGLILAQDPLLPSADVGLGHSMSGRAYEAGAENVTVGASSTATGVSTPVTISNLYLGLDLQLSGPILNGPCKLELQIPTTTINARFDLAPQASDPSKVDVNLVGSPAVTLTGVHYEFISGICDPSTFLIGSIINSLAGSQIETSIRDGFQAQLGDADGAGPADSPIADAIETALSQISIAGSVGEAVKANLSAPFRSITETNTAIDFRADVDFFTTFGTGPSDCQPPAGAPDYTSTFDVPGVYPTLGGTTPSGSPYGLGLVISSSAFNQLLSSMTECGLLNQDVTEFNGLPITPSLLSLLIPAFATVDPSAEVFIRVDPNAAPFITDAPQGIDGAMADMQLADLSIDFIQRLDLGNGDTADHRLLGLSVEAPLGLTMGYDDVNGVLAPTITAPQADDVNVRVSFNGIGADEASLSSVFGGLFPSFVDDLGSGFAAFPLPAFLGLDLSIVEIARQGQYFTLYSNLDPAPATKITDVTVTDLSTGDFATDSCCFDSDEWRHRNRKKVSDTGVDVDLKGVIGADAWATTGDKTASATASGRVSFNVVPANGETWRIDLAHSIAGAHTLVSEGVGGGYGGESRISTVTGRYRVGSGAWTNFNFNPSTMNTGFRSGESGVTYNFPFTGGSSANITGTTAQTITVEFGFDLFAKSDSNAFFPAEAGIEAAVRFGANDSLTNNFTAGDYPGAGNRNIAADGYKLSIALSVI